MCTANAILFGIKNLTKEEIGGKEVLEIGSLDVNGSLRAVVELFRPARYIGVDIENGPGVDIVCRAEEIIDKFGKETFDIVISTELIEHIKDWKKVISNIKNICRPNGIALITTRSYGFRYHAFPYDFWRYEVSDLEYIFSDCAIEKLEKETFEPGVFIKAIKPKNFVEKNLSDYCLYSIIVNKRIKSLDEKSLEMFIKRKGRIDFLKRIAENYIFKR